MRIADHTGLFHVVQNFRKRQLDAAVQLRQLILPQHRFILKIQIIYDLCLFTCIPHLRFKIGKLRAGCCTVDLLIGLACRNCRICKNLLFGSQFGVGKIRHDHHIISE